MLLYLELTLNLFFILYINSFSTEVNLPYYILTNFLC